ncbi:hypothetical protein BDV93DRAFT_610988 [Ceratobasidium sp. AG-I]|nr:hypothetical protein BDV93DRAFT_610988 [Ceratobasidium sp. AG-I]
MLGHVGLPYFSTEKSDESILPHVFTLLRALDAHAFRLVAAIPIGGRSRSKDLWIFTAPGVSSTGSGSVAGSVGVGASTTTSPYQATMDSEWTYTSGPETASPVIGHGKFATDEPARGEFGMGAGMAGIGAGNGSKGHRRSSSAPVAAGGSKGRKPVPALTPPRGSPSESPGLKGTPPPIGGVRGSPVTKTNPMPSPMVMPVPTIPPSLSSTQSPAQSSTPLGSSPTMVPVPIPPQKRNSSLLKKFRAGGGSGRTASGRFNHPPPPPTVRNGNGSPPNGIPPNPPNGTSVNGIGAGMPERKRTIVSGEVIYETPAPPSSGSPTPNVGVSPAPPITPPATGATGFVPPPPPPPIPKSPIGVDGQAFAMPIPVVPSTFPPAPAPQFEEENLAPPERPGMLTPANRTTEELLLPRGAFRDSAFSASTDQSHDVAVAWTGPGSLGGFGNIGTAGLGGAHGGLGGKAGDLEGVKEGEEVDEIEARSPDVTRTIHEDARPKSERAELALAAAVDSKQEDKEKKEPRRPSVGSKSGAPNEWVFVSVDKGLGKDESESSGASPPPIPSSPPLEDAPVAAPPELGSTRRGSFRRWFGRGETERTKPKEVVVGASGKARRRRGGMAQALRSSKRLTIE